MINELKAREKELLTELSGIRKQIFNYTQNECFEKYGVRVGSIIRAENGNEYKLSQVRYSGAYSPSLSGHKRKKDGDFGISVNYIHTPYDKEINIIEP